MESDQYVIRGGLPGRERLRVLARVMWPTTDALLARVGVAPDARCLDVGCGGGDVSIPLARLAADGQVIGVDVDRTKLDVATAEAAEAGVRNVSFLEHDVTGVTDGAVPEGWTGGFDLLYMRFLLTHLRDPAGAITGFVSLLRPGGVLVAEDIDFRGHFCEPASPAFDRYVELYSQAARARGCDPDIGPRLPSLLARGGLVERGMRVVQPAGFDGEVKLLAAITLEAVAGSILTSGLAAEDEVDQLVADLYGLAATEGTVISLPRVVQAWGRRAP